MEDLNMTTPPRELVEQWQGESPEMQIADHIQHLVTRAAQWGYNQANHDIECKLQEARDQELEACCAELESIPSPLGIPFGKMAGNALRAVRRPKSPSLKEQALTQLDEVPLNPQSPLRSDTASSATHWNNFPMTKEQNPIALPSPELRAKWRSEAPRNRDAGISREDYLMDRAAQWGADQELEACCALMDDWGLDGNDLMECRRPKPPSLKEAALKELAWVDKNLNANFFRHCDAVHTISRALEALPDDRT